MTPARATAISLLRAAGYHGDDRLWARLYVENRISFPAAMRARREGKAMLERGVRCGCSRCKDDPLRREVRR